MIRIRIANTLDQMSHLRITVRAWDSIVQDTRVLFLTLNHADDFKNKTSKISYHDMRFIYFLGRNQAFYRIGWEAQHRISK